MQPHPMHGNRMRTAGIGGLLDSLESSNGLTRDYLNGGRSTCISSDGILQQRELFGRPCLSRHARSNVVKPAVSTHT